jgi:hypothetical protein
MTAGMILQVKILMTLPPRRKWWNISQTLLSMTTNPIAQNYLALLFKRERLLAQMSLY